MLENVRIVLVETSHTGNMGSTARAMKTMGLTNLYLVNPKVEPDSQAIALAAGASDVIGQAKIVSSLDEAIAGCALVIGTSARSRSLQWPLIEPRECGQRIATECAQHPVALVFGRERVGLTNEELALADVLTGAPMVADYPSLNLGQAVMVYCYQLASLIQISQPPVTVSDENQLAALRVRADKLLAQLGVADDQKMVDWLQQRLGRLEQRDTAMLHRLLHDIEKKISRVK